MTEEDFLEELDLFKKREITSTNRSIGETVLR